MGKKVIHLNKNEQSLGITFFPLSSVKSYKDFIIAPFSLESLQKISKSSNLKPRIEEENRKQNLTKFKKKLS